ncbi:phasin family protein [Micromonospora sp. NPDC047557]|uniref:phasin family protein n=1 Tax=Micromonospora sp. NPDC047557 TaxID=3364250 RepID=UPI003715715E
MQDAWRAYLELALGLAEAPRKKAQDAVRRLVGSGGATAAQLQALGEELVTTGAANREALTKLVRFEVDRALGAVGLATADEVAELTRRVRDLERQLREARATEMTAGPAPQAAAPSTGPAPQPDPTRAAQPGSGPVRSDGPAGAPVSAPVARKASDGPAAAPVSAVAKKAVAKKALAKKAIVKKPPATISRTGDDTPPPVVQDDTPTPAVMPAKKAARKRRPDGDS